MSVSYVQSRMFSTLTDETQSYEPEPGVVTVFADGACRPNPGPGGYGALLLYRSEKDPEHVGRKELNGHIPATTTNNRAELIAVIKALEAIHRPSKVRVYTDSRYVVTIAAGGKARANLDLVHELRTLIDTHVDVDIRHVGREHNQRAHNLAQLGARLKVDAFLESFAGQYLVIAGDSILGHAPTKAQALEDAKSNAPATPWTANQITYVVDQADYPRAA